MKEKIANQIYNEDCIVGMQKIKAKSVDLIITDPPFAIKFGKKKANYNRKDSRVLKGYGEVLQSEYSKFTHNWMEQAYRTLRESGSMYVFSGWNHLGDILAGLDSAGFTVVNHLVWKYQFGVVTSRKFVTSHYHCLYVCVNDKKRTFYPFSRFGKNDKDENNKSLHYADKEDVWYIKREYWSGMTKTPTKLPRKIVEKILEYSSKKGDLVMDPFLGSGQVAVVSKLMGRKYAGFEVVKQYYEFIQHRLESGGYGLKHAD
ncbi:MAG: DNA methylase N-4/N-6 domain-containing protein (ccrM) [Cenarchaeum symbiont of Oopsacas minuta]|nr:DNA methylase N-4/N-6 domain-containing protein (ccrM) [Cenarchaeum symbiont of Oopsacas minuta]